MTDHVDVAPPWREWNKDYYARNREQEKERAKKWQRGNPERKRENDRRWRAANRAKLDEKDRAWREANPERYKAIRQRSAFRARLKKRGITLEEYEALLDQQEGRCGICRTDKAGAKKDWCIDHDHASGRVRGLLCHHCNVALGSVRDNPEILRRMIRYLEV